MAEQSDLPLRGSGFNTDPQTGDWDQLAYENHSLVERVRGENTDTDDAFAIYVQGVAQTTKVFNVLKTGAIYVGSTNTAVLSATSGITLGAAAAAGSGTAALRYDATILAFRATNPLPVGSVASYGSSSLASRDDHAHLGVTSIAASGNSALSGAVDLVAGSGIGLTQTGQGITIVASTAVPAGASSGVPAVTWGTTNAAGAAGTFVDTAARIQLYDGTAPSAMTIGGAVVQGVGSFAARSDHGHAISNLNVSLLGGSWGSGPTLTNPQVAATGWASANHTHVSGNTGGLISTGTPTDVQSFATSGIWTKPSGSPKLVMVIAFGAGGGGGGGVGGAAGSNRNSGGAGGGGARQREFYDPSALAATVTVTIGVGGTSGAGGSSADGSAGGNGGSTTFGSHLFAGGGAGGSAGTGGGGVNGGGGGGASSSSTSNAGGGPAPFATATSGDRNGRTGGTGGQAVQASGCTEEGGAGGGSSTAVNANALSGGSSLYAGPGGGGGGPVGSDNVARDSGAGGAFNSYAVGGGGAGGAGGAGTNAGTTGTSRSLTGKAGDGGGGGGSSTAATGGAGGNGGAPAAGAGGGGGGTNVGGAGGVGARGEVIVYTIY